MIDKNELDEDMNNEELEAQRAQEWKKYDEMVEDFWEKHNIVQAEEEVKTDD